MKVGNVEKDFLKYLFTKKGSVRLSVLLTAFCPLSSSKEKRHTENVRARKVLDKLEVKHLIEIMSRGSDQAKVRVLGRMAYTKESKGFVINNGGMYIPVIGSYKYGEKITEGIGKNDT